MRHRTHYSRILCVLALLIPAASASTNYVVNPLPAGPTYTSLDNNGDVGGGNGIDPVIATVSGITVQSLPGGDNFATANAINNSELIGGTGVDSTGAEIAFIGTTSLGLTGFKDTFGNGINDSGQLAGQITRTNNTTAGFIATISGGYTVFPGAIVLTGINSSGVAVGTGTTDHTVFGTIAAGLTPLPLIPGITAMGGFDINSAGRICGNASNGGSVPIQAYFYNGSSSSLISLLPGFTESEVAPGCVDSSNQVVGTDIPGSGSDAGFIWDPVNGAQSLSTLALGGWTITNALAINDNGDILAEGTNGTTTGFLLLTPAPEPATLPLALLAISILAATRLQSRLRQRMAQGKA